MARKIHPRVVTAIGVAAFVIGGIITREKTIEGVETLERFLNKDRSETEEE